ncbi:MAG: phage baseplate assembly protein V [Bacteroidales bacterium]
MLQQVQITVKVGGKNISPITYCCVNQTIDWHHKFEVVYVADFYKEKYNAILNKIRDFIGSEIEIIFESIENGQNSVKNRFYGLVTEARLNRTSSGSKEIHIYGYSPTILIDGRPNYRSFTEKLLNDVVQAALDNIPQNDLKLNSNPSFRDEIPYIVQYNESNFHFLNRIADKYGEWCFYKGSELIFGSLNKSKVIEIIIDRNLIGFDFSFSLKNLNYKAVTYEYLENKTFNRETKNYAVNDLDPHGDHSLSRSERAFKQDYIVFSDENFQKESDFNDYYETKRIADTRKLICNEGSSTNPSINAGSVIKIKSDNNQESDFGEFIITAIEHTIDSERKYENHFKAIPKQNNKPPTNDNVKLPECNIQPAIVTDNDDPEKLGRVKVRFFWQTPQDSTPWLRIIHAHGGKTANGDQHGFYFIPEIDDEVMVGFESNNPDKPFVIGSVYHKNSKPDHWYHAGNNTKSIRTRNGNQIILIDENGKEEIRILNKDDASPTNEISLSLNNNGKITIKSVGDLEISAENIKISANTDITMESGQDTKLKANDYQLDANNSIKLTGQQITIEGQNSTAVKGQSQLDLEGTNTSVKGQAQLKLEGTQTEIDATQLKMQGDAQTEISGAIVKVAGTGVTEITGGLVKIN